VSTPPPPRSKEGERLFPGGKRVHSLAIPLSPGGFLLFKSSNVACTPCPWLKTTTPAGLGTSQE
jgi:hypothetical protein